MLLIKQKPKQHQLIGSNYFLKILKLRGIFCKNVCVCVIQFDIFFKFDNTYVN